MGLTLGASMFAVLFATGALSDVESGSVFEEIKAHHAKLQSLYVLTRMVEHKADLSKPDQAMDVEYAFSGDKTFSCSSNAYPVDGESPGRMFLFVWNGKNFISYNYGLKSGMVLPPKEGGKPPQTEAASQFLYYTGVFTTNETFSQLFARIPREKWNVERDDAGKVVLTSDSVLKDTSGVRYSWVMDSSRGYAVTEAQVAFEDPKTPGKFKIMYKETAGEIKEACPGVWLPIDGVGLILDDSGNPIETNTFHVQKIAVNDAATDELFNFQIPRGSNYYDGALDEHFIVGDDNEVMALDENKDSSPNQDISQKQTPASESSSSIPNDSYKPSSPKSSNELLQIVLVALLGGAASFALIFVMIRRARRRVDKCDARR